MNQSQFPPPEKKKKLQLGKQRNCLTQFTEFMRKSSTPVLKDKTLPQFLHLFTNDNLLFPAAETCYHPNAGVKDLNSIIAPLADC